MLSKRCKKLWAYRPWQLAWILAVPVWLAWLLWLQPELDPDWPLAAPKLFLFLVLVYPVLEELVFRGLLQGWLMQRPALQRGYAGFTLANVLTSSLFAALHVFTHAALMALLVLLPSLLFGYFRDRFSGWLLPSMLLHMYYNLGYFLVFKPL